MYNKFGELIVRIWNFPMEGMNRIIIRIVNSSIAILIALVFLYIFKPFGFDYWIEILFSPQWIAPIVIAFIATGIVSISLLVGYLMFKDTIYKLGYLILSILGESLALTLILAILSLNDSTSLWKEITTTLVMVLPTMIFCYFIASLIITLKVRDVVDNNSGNVSEDMKRSLYSLYDDSGQLRLSVKVEDIVMFKSEDNYVEIYYMIEGRLKNQLIRKRLKQIDDETCKFGFARCHRSYLVNLSSVSKIEKSGRSYSVILNGIKGSVPISRSFQKQFLSSVKQ